MLRLENDQLRAIGNDLVAFVARCGTEKHKIIGDMLDEMDPSHKLRYRINLVGTPLNVGIALRQFLYQYGTLDSGKNALQTFHEKVSEELVKQGLVPAFDWSALPPQDGFELIQPTPQMPGLRYAYRGQGVYRESLYGAPEGGAPLSRAATRQTIPGIGFTRPAREPLKSHIRYELTEQGKQLAYTTLLAACQEGQEHLEQLDRRLENRASLNWSGTAQEMVDRNFLLLCTSYEKEDNLPQIVRVIDAACEWYGREDWVDLRYHVRPTPERAIPAGAQAVGQFVHALHGLLPERLKQDLSEGKLNGIYPDAPRLAVYLFGDDPSMRRAARHDTISELLRLIGEPSQAVMNAMADYTDSLKQQRSR